MTLTLPHCLQNPDDADALRLLRRYYARGGDGSALRDWSAPRRRKCRQERELRRQEWELGRAEIERANPVDRRWRVRNDWPGYG